MNIYFTGNNLEEIKKVLQDSGLEVLETGKGVIVIKGDGTPVALNPLDQISQPSKDSGFIIIPKKQNIEMIAALCHEANAGLCRCYGDMSQPSWKDAPQWQKDSAINGVIMHLTNPAATPSMSHDSWMAEKVADGWVYGEKKDPEAKTHPCMVDFNKLPKEQQAKDYVFRSIVHQQSALSFPGLHLQLAASK